MKPPAVRYGLMTEEQYQSLEDAASREDQNHFIELAVKYCHNNVPLFNNIFLGFDVTPHFMPVSMAVKNNKSTMVLLPRSHGKSVSLAIGYPTHHICYSTIEGSGYEDISILLLQESTTAVKSSIMAIQEALEKQPLIKAAFGNIKDRSRKWNEDTIALQGRNVSKEYTLYGRGAKSSITGAHPKLLICDDVVTKENSKTQHLRDDMWQWWTKTVVGLIDPGTKTIILGTPYYSDDLYQRLIDTDRYRILKRKALNRPIEKEDYELEYDDDGTIIDIDITEQGEDLKALWPCPLGTGNCPMTEEHFEEYGLHRPVEWLILEKYLEDPIGFSSQYMLEVLGSQTSRIKPGMLRFYSHTESDIGQPTEYNEHPIARWPHPDDVVSIVHAWDHAIGKKRANDNTAFARAIRTKDNKIFYELRAGKWGFEEALRRMENWYESEPYGKPSAIVTEAIGFQQAYSESLLERSKKILPIEPVKKTVDKDQFLLESQVLTAMTNGQVYFDINDKETITELLAFSPDGSSGYHDDRVDAIALAFSKIKDTVRRDVRVYRMAKRRGAKRRGMNKYYKSDRRRLR